MNLAGIIARRSAALPAAPLIFGFAWYAGKAQENVWSGDWMLGSGQVNTALLWPVALVAAVAAWDTSRVRRTGADTLERTYPRSGLAHLLLSGLPALIVGLLSSLIAFLVVATSIRGGGEPLWDYLFLSELMFVAATAIGVAFGYVLPRYLAAPMTGIGLWLFMAYGAISDHRLVQRLVVLDHECCSVSRELQVLTLAGQALWLLAITLGCACVLCWRRPQMAKRIGVLAAVALVVGMTFLQRSDSRLTTARQPAEAVCRTEAEVTACMWPEHSEHLDRWLKIARRYRETFADIRPRETLFAEKGTKWTGPEPIPIGSISPGTSDEHLVESLATSTLRRPPDCARLPSEQPDMTSYGPYPGMIGRELAAAWMKHRIRPDLPPQGLGVPGRDEQVQRLLAAPEDAQVDWVRRALRAGDECENPMPELP